MSNQVNAKAGLSVKDLVTTGIFTALLFVFIMVGGVFFATNPMLTFFMPAPEAIATEKASMARATATVISLKKPTKHT